MHAALVDVLLATWNGERHLAALLDSLLAQTYPHFRLLVSDDGSIDGTRAVLERYRPRFGGRLLLLPPRPAGRGGLGNFEYLMQASLDDAQAPWAMFCDQDDVWLPEKIAQTLAAMQRTELGAEPGTPCLVHTDLRVVDEALAPIAESFVRYQHMDPAGVGNDMRLLVSDMAGRASIELKGRELGFDLSGDRELVTRITDRVKRLENRGYTFEAADASFELLLIEEVEGARPSYFDVESWRVITETLAKRSADEEAVSEATVKLKAGGVRYVVTGEGNGPVNALDHALREAIVQAYPQVAKFELIDYKVRILDQGHGTDAITRVLIETSDGESSWVTVGVGANVIEASWGALVDGLTFGLRKHEA